MNTAARVRDHIGSLSEKKIFTTRELLYCGKRNAIDLVLFKMVNDDLILRLARGVFIKRTKNQFIPSVLKIAKAKAKAFRKKISENGNEAAKRFDFPFTKDKIPKLHKYYTSGCRSSFLCVHGKVMYLAVCPRKMELSRSKVGSLLKAIWFLGFDKRFVSRVKARYHEGQLGNKRRLIFREEIKQVPEWIYNAFYPTGWYAKVRGPQFTSNRM